MSFGFWKMVTAVIKLDRLIDNDNETQHTIFPGNIFSEAKEDVNIYKSIIWY